MRNLFLIILFCLTSGTVFAFNNPMLIYGHLGARGLAPENTIPAYNTGLAIGIDYVDMDVNMTKDGVVVVSHNYALNPDLTRDAKGKWISYKKKIFIKNLTFKQLQTYDVGRLRPDCAYKENFPEQYPVDGTHISSLKEIINYVNKLTNNKIRFQVEIKTDPAHPNWTFTPDKIATAVVKVLKETGVDKRTELQAFDWRVLQVVQKEDPKIATAYLTNHTIADNMTSPYPQIAGLWSGGHLLKDYNDSIPKMIAALGGKIWGPESIELRADLVATAHKYGLKVVPWTVDSPAEIRRMIKIGVDGIITDRPDLLRGILAQRAMPIPAGK